VTAAGEAGSLLEHLFRHQGGRMVAHLTRLLGPAHIDLAEETVQEAMLRALQTWPYEGAPENAGAWLFRVAHNAAIDAVRRNRLLSDKSDAIVRELSQSASAAEDNPDLEEQLRDDELRMIFMCCHPDISRDSSVALSLKTVGGFSVREIARAFLADDAAIAQRLVRAKSQIRERRLTLDMPRGAELKSRVASVLYGARRPRPDPPGSLLRSVAAGMPGGGFVDCNTQCSCSGGLDGLSSVAPRSSR
jgi:RNA polymerase sigma-70 factor (ECF subfamily)